MLFRGFVQIILLALINNVSGENLMDNVYITQALDINVGDSRDFFSTLHVASINDCTTRCYSVTSCRVGNYRRRGHICELIHVVGDIGYGVFYLKRAGYLSWTDVMLEKVFSEDRSPCSSCFGSKSCEVDYDNRTCEFFACGQPVVPKSFTTKGNVYTVDGKLQTSTCYNHEDDVIMPNRTLTCADDAQWIGPNIPLSAWNNDCTFTRHTMSDGTSFVYKIVNVQVPQDTALTRCQKDGANLTTIFTQEKLDFYRTIFLYDFITGEDYWVDARRVDGSEWRTSDGRIQPMGYDLWREFDKSFWKANDDCVRMRKDEGYLLDDWDCNVHFSYICERQIWYH